MALSDELTSNFKQSNGLHMFTANDDKPAFQEEFCELLDGIRKNLPLANTNDVFTNFRQVLDLPKDLQTFHGILSRNAHSLNPISDFHIYLSEQSPRRQDELIQMYSTNQKLQDFFSNGFMAGLCIEGVGLFEVINSMNHSCSPNAFISSSDNSNR